MVGIIFDWFQLFNHNNRKRTRGRKQCCWHCSLSLSPFAFPPCCIPGRGWNAKQMERNFLSRQRAVWQWRVVHHCTMVLLGVKRCMCRFWTAVGAVKSGAKGLETQSTHNWSLASAFPLRWSGSMPWVLRSLYWSDFDPKTLLTVRKLRSLFITVNGGGGHGYAWEVLGFVSFNCGH